MGMNKPLRLLILADINSPHTQKWVMGLSECNIQVGIFSFNTASTPWFEEHPNIICLQQAKSKQNNSILSKLNYLLHLPLLLWRIKQFKPDILHAHYASSYGFIAALSFFKPLLVSVWGSDITQFPQKSWIHRSIIKFVFYRAKKISGTSTLLKKEVARHTGKTCEVIPFGIDLNNFYSLEEKHHPSVFTIGVIKHLETIYNIDKVLDAFAILRKQHPHQKFVLKIIGEGSLEQSLKKQSEDLHLGNDVEFVGKVDHKLIPDYLHQLDVLVNVSDYESFGVSVAEAMACKIPVIVSPHDGFKDLVPNTAYAIVVPQITAFEIFKALDDYYLHEEKRKQVTENSFDRIQTKFNWLQNVKQMEKLYGEMNAIKN